MNFYRYAHLKIDISFVQGWSEPVLQTCTACLVVLPNARRASDRFVHCVLGVKWGGGHVAAPFVPMVVALVLNFLCTQYYRYVESCGNGVNKTNIDFLLHTLLLKTDHQFFFLFNCLVWLKFMLSAPFTFLHLISFWNDKKCCKYLLC